jgi:O-antigen/teichoic acid export membrane protein
LTSVVALLVGAGSHWLLQLFGTTYARESAGLLRWLAAAAPLTVLAQLYFTRLRVQKHIRPLVLGSAGIAVVTLGISLWLMPRFGIAATGIGWTLAHGLLLTAGWAATHLWQPPRAPASGLRPGLSPPESRRQ